MPQEPEVRAAILLAYPSVYAFCKANTAKVTKSVVNMVLAGTYPGNVEKQRNKILKILEGTKEVDATVESISLLLASIACARCPRRPQTGKTKKRCRTCRSLWQEQAAAIIKTVNKETI